MDKTSPKSGYWYYNPTRTRSQRGSLYAQHRSFLYEVLFRAVTKHDLREGFWLLELLPRCSSIDCYVVFRYIMIMISTVKTKKINKNFIIYLETLLSKLTLSKPDVFVELISYFMSNKRIDDARELFNQRNKFMLHLRHRRVPLMEINISCYDFLLNYLEWKGRLPAEKNVQFDVSIQGWLVNGMHPLMSTNHNYEIFAMCITNVLLHYGFWKKVYLFLSEFQRSNPDNVTAQLLLYNLIEKLPRSTGTKRRKSSCDLTTCEEEESREQYRSSELSAINNFSPEESRLPLRSDSFPLVSDKRQILKQLTRLDPTCDELLDLSTDHLSKVESIRLVMDSLEHVSKIRDPSRWRFLQHSLDELLTSNDAALVEEMTKLWQKRYKPFWRLKDFLALFVDPKAEIDTKQQANQQLITRVIRTLKSEFD